MKDDLPDQRRPEYDMGQFESPTLTPPDRPAIIPHSTAVLDQEMDKCA